MKTQRKTHSPKKHKQSRRKAIAVSVFVLLAGLLVIMYISFPSTNEAGAFQAFTNHYLGIMKNLNSTETKLEMASELDPKYNFTDLFTWEHDKLTFGQDPAGWFEDSFEILREGMGVCVQFSIVYVAACLALGYQARLVVAANTTIWAFIHVWAEVYFNGSWVHVDPSDQVWNQPSRYRDWSWGKDIGRDVKIYSFEDGSYKEVTSTYS